MLSLTQLLDTPIRTPDGAEIARLRDVVVRVTPPPGAAASAPTRSGSHPSPAGDEPYPPVVGLVADELEPSEGEGDTCFIPWGKVARLDAEGAELRGDGTDFAAFAPRDDELALRAGLLERYVVDLAGERLVRVNDVALEERDGALRLVAVDASAGTLLRRLGLGGFGERLLARVTRGAGGPAQPALLDWQRVVPLVEGGDVAGQPAGWFRAKAARLNAVDPAELADVIAGLTPRQAGLLLNAMDATHAADTIEEMDDERQAQALRAMDRERAADVLEEMDPDEAADALQALREVDTAEAADLMDHMDREDAEEVQELSAYPPDTAGGLMTTDYVAVAGDITAGALLEALRARAAEAEAGEADPVPEALMEMYVVEERPGARTTAGAAGVVRLDAEGRLVGVVGLRELVLARPDAPLASIMRPVDEVAAPLDDARAVARTIADADLMALPVVDEAGDLLGIVTVDDAIDVILPAGWRGRPLRRPH